MRLLSGHRRLVRLTNPFGRAEPAAQSRTRPLTITPSLDIAGDRWSDVNPAPAFPYVRTGAYTLINLSAQYAVASNFDVVVGFKNLNDENYELAWGFPQPGRTFYIKTRIGR